MGSTPWLAVLFTLTLATFYGFFGYDLDRSDFVKLISFVFALFALSYALISRYGHNFKSLLLVGLLLRLVFIVALPNLSQDFYRFIWDGRLLWQGVSPYLYTPDIILNQSEIVVAQGQELANGMGGLNASHYSNYPPLNQLFFAFGGLFGGQNILASVVGMRILIILADIGTLLFAKKILDHLHLSFKKVWWLYLNPFIILELTGNLHFEGVMLFFMVASFYFLLKNKWLISAILLGCAISLKLIPLLLLPVLFWWFVKRENPLGTFKQLVFYYGIVMATVLVTFLPFYNADLVANFSDSIALWFQKFEFNASIYYIIRWIGYETIGWNIIADVGKILPLIVVAGVTLISLVKQRNSFSKLATGMLFAIFLYLLLSTTVHPWYVATPLLLCVFTRYYFPIVWSALIFLSYSAYGYDGFSENLWLVTAEYSIVIGVCVFELSRSKASLNLQSPAR
ncbi:MAG: mannosyltransferase [Gilvibacter sp.]